MKARKNKPQKWFSVILAIAMLLTMAPLSGAAKALDTGNSTPFGGSDWPLPGKIQFEDFDLGGEGVAYHDADTIDHGQKYRLDETMDIGSSDTGYELFWNENGEWVNYTVDAEAGSYKINARCVSYPDTPGKLSGILHFYLGSDEIATMPLTPTGGNWSDRRIYSLDGVTITPQQAGSGKALRVVIENGNCNLDWFEFVKKVEYTAQELADGITLSNPKADQTALNLPAMPSGFGVKIASSSRTDIIALDGKITPPGAEAAVSLVLTVYSVSDPQDKADTGILTVTVPKATVDSAPVTMAAYGARVKIPGNWGDTWDTAWGADGNLYAMLNDGSGFNGVNDNSKVLKIEGTPEDPSTIRGTDLNNGILGSSASIGNSYSSGIYEVDGALYFIAVKSRQVPQAWQFYNGALLKSTDGGKTWLNTQGEKDAYPLIEDSNATFKVKDMADFSFVKYGQGGEAPAGGVDRSDEYVYLITPSGCYGADYYMARISRRDLSDWTTTFDLSKIEYYTGGDGMLDQNWTNRDFESKRASLIHDDYGEQRGYPRWSPANVVYNPTLKRYFMMAQNSDSFSNPPVQSTLYTFEAPHPWGPWTMVQEEHVDYKENSNLTWPYFMQKYQSENGKKMWMTVCGDGARGDYCLQFKPVYLTTEPIQGPYEAEDADLVGTQVSTAAIEAPGEKYVNGFNQAGDKAAFHVNADETGAYFVRFRYHTKQQTTLSYYVNGNYQEEILFGKSEQVYADWAEYTVFSWLNEGDNTITFQLNGSNAGDIDLDYLEFALYSTEPNSLPGCNGDTPDPTAVTLDKEAVTAGLNQQIPLWATVTGSSSPALVYSSSDPAVASVNGRGMVTTKAAGTAVITVTADGQSTARCVFTVQQGASFQAPCQGRAHAVPGAIPFMDYDEGGDGYAYHDSDPQNRLGGYRLDEGVDVGAGGAFARNGNVIGWVTDEGEWMEYTANIEPGTYRLDAHVSSYLDVPTKRTGILHFYVDSVEVATIDLSRQTSGYYDFQDYTADNITLAGGENKVIRVAIDNGNCNLDEFTFTKK